MTSDTDGNPTLKTLLAVLKLVGMRLSVEPENHAHAWTDLVWDRLRHRPDIHISRQQTFKVSFSTPTADMNHGRTGTTVEVVACR